MTIFVAAVSELLEKHYFGRMCVWSCMSVCVCVCEWVWMHGTTKVRMGNCSSTSRGVVWGGVPATRRPSVVQVSSKCRPSVVVPDMLDGRQMRRAVG